MNKKFFDQKRVENLLNKIKTIQTKNKFDLSSDEDLSLAIMNLISIEEHLFFSAEKTGKTKYFAVLNEVREMRKNLMKQLIPSYEGEVWCISKHLLAAAMRLFEVGTKALNRGKQKQAEEFFQSAYGLYSLFWGLGLKVVKTKELKADLAKMGFSDDEFIDSEKIIQKKSGFFAKLGELVKKAIDCCIE